MFGDATVVELPPEAQLDDPWSPDVEELIRRDPLGGALTPDGLGESVPPELDDPGRSLAVLEPSGWSGLELDVATADPALLGDADLVDAIVGFDRMGSWAGARQARLLAEFARRRPGDAPEAANCDKPSLISRYAPDEIGLALHLSRGTAIVRLGRATQLGRVLPATLDAWERGHIDEAKVRAICEATWVLDDDMAARVQDRVLTRATDQTAAQLRAALKRAVIAVDPDGAAARHKQARKDRRVAVGQENEGMASLWALLPAPGALSAYQWLTRLARGLGREDPRGMDARRADLLVELLTGRLTLTTPDDATSDTGASDTGASGTGTSNTSDAGASDTGASDTGTGDTGTGDAGTGDAGTGDAGISGTGAGGTGAGDMGTSVRVPVTRAPAPATPAPAPAPTSRVPEARAPATAGPRAVTDTFERRWRRWLPASRWCRS